MTKKQYIVGPIMVAIIAAIVQIVDQLGFLNFISDGASFGWVSFQSWAIYFLGGCTIVGGIRAFNSYLLGVIGSILIMVTGNALSALGFAAFPIAVFIWVIPIISLEKAGKWFDYVPALFVGAGAFFAYMNYVPNATYFNGAVTIMVFCVLGLLAGWATIFVRTHYENMLKK